MVYNSREGVLYAVVYKIIMYHTKYNRMIMRSSLLCYYTLHKLEPALHVLLHLRGGGVLTANSSIVSGGI